MDLVVSIGVGMEVAFNELEDSRGLLFSFLNVLFVDRGISNGVVRHSGLNDASSTWGCHNLGLMRDFLKFSCQNISFDQAVAVGQVVMVN